MIIVHMKLVHYTVIHRTVVRASAFSSGLKWTLLLLFCSLLLSSYFHLHFFSVSPSLRRLFLLLFAPSLLYLSAG